MLICLLGSKQSCTRSVCKSRLGSCKLRQYQAFSIRCDHRVYAYRPSENSRARADRNNPVCPVSLSPAFPLLNLTQARARRSIRVRFYLLATATATVEEGKFSSSPFTLHDLASCRARLGVLAKQDNLVAPGTT